MKNKKLVLLISGILSFTIIFSACGKEEEVQDSGNTSEIVSETIGEPVATPPAADVLETEAVNDNNSESSSEDSSEVSNLRAAVDEVTSSVEWAKLDEITDSAIMLEFFKLDKDNENYNDILVMQCPMSSVIAEIIIIDAKDGQVETAKTDLTARQDKLINVDAFYPDSKAIAEESIVGTYNNTAYFIAGENAAQSEEILIQALENQGY